MGQSSMIATFTEAIHEDNDIPFQVNSDITGKKRRFEGCPGAFLFVEREDYMLEYWRINLFVGILSG
jgi:hypothetical protein